MKPLVSIITASWNIEDTVEKTIQSVLSQSFTNFEYIIKDGNSKDKTVEIIHKYKNKLAYFESSPDKNLYDAMNIATQHAQGEWLFYLQGDDTFYDEKTLEKIAKYLERTDADIVYGKVLMSYPWGLDRLIDAKPASTMWWHLPFSQQGAFVRTDLMKKYPFDFARYKISADYDNYYKLYALGHKYEAIQVTVSRMSAGGRSDKQRMTALAEVFRIKKVYDKNIWHLLLHRLYMLRTFVNLQIRNMLPKQTVEKIFNIREKLRP